MGKLVLSAMALLALSLAACGGDDDGADADDARPEDDLAESALLTVNDFPSGWALDTSEEDEEDSPLDECVPERGDEITGPRREW